MDNDSFKAWLEIYGRAWKTRNPNLIPDLFTDEASYHEKAFDEPITGIKKILDYWNVVSKTQKNIHFDYVILSVDSSQGIAHWSASFIRLNPNELVELDGIFLVRLNSQNKCTQFREWWQSKKTVGKKLSDKVF